MSTVKFIAGKTYFTGSVCDQDAKFVYTIIKRTAKTVTLKVMGNVKSFRVTLYEGVEQIKPQGNYSMCPVLKADREDIPEPEAETSAFEKQLKEDGVEYTTNGSGVILRQADMDAEKYSHLIKGYDVISEGCVLVRNYLLV